MPKQAVESTKFGIDKVPKEELTKLVAIARVSTPKADQRLTALAAEYSLTAFEETQVAGRVNELLLLPEGAKR